MKLGFQLDAISHKTTKATTMPRHSLAIRIFMPFLLPIVLLTILDAKESLFTSSEFGFSISPPVVLPEPENGFSPVMFFLPRTGGFSPNVGVRVEPFSGHLASYSEITLQQLKRDKLKIIKFELDEAGLRWEFSGKIDNNQFRWYSRGVVYGPNAITITATAFESQWHEVGPQLIKCVESFNPAHP